MTTPIRVFAMEYECPNGSSTCYACRACGPTHWAVRPPSVCFSACEGNYVDYLSIVDAMATHPTIPWWQLPVVFGEDPEPELVAAVESHTAENPPGPV